MTLSKGKRLGHYEVLSPIGAGGMGEVYLARDVQLHRQVALKLLPDDVASQPERMRRFSHEAKAASALNHPNILTIYEFGVANDVHFLATEFIDGFTLRERRKESRLTVLELVDVMLQVASALSAAHEAGIIHRDVKPDNIMIRPDGIVKVLDFGLAKLDASSLGATGSRELTESGDHTSPGTVLGTVQYMSPEQARGREVDVRTDVFSFGVVLYEEIAGRLPFAGDTSADVLAAILAREPEPLETIVRDVPEGLRHIVTKCLYKNRDRRYSSMRDVVPDLRRLRDRLVVNERNETLIFPEPDGLDYNQPTVVASSATTGNGAARPSEAGAVPTTSPANRHATLIGSRQRVAVMLLAVLAAGALLTWWYLLRGGASDTEPIASIAVLPFSMSSPVVDAEYISDGLAESLIHRLSHLPNLRVSPTSSVIRYRGRDIDPLVVGNELGVHAVMTGRIVQHGSRLTISVELLDVRSNSLLWGERYDRELSELLATQRQIATEIVHNLKMKLTGEGEQALTGRYTDNNEAYQLYLKGRFYFAKRSKEDILRGIDAFEQATRLDPTFALAYVGIAESYTVMPSFPYMAPRDAMPQAKAAIAHALQLDPELPEAHTVAAVIASVYDWDWAVAESEFKRSLELDPKLAITHYRYGWVYLSPLGRHDEAIAEMRRAMELEPMSLMQGANYGAVYLYARQFDLALEQARQTVELDPAFGAGLVWLGHAYNANGMYAECLRISEPSLRTDSPMLSQAGYAFAKTSRQREARDVIGRWREAEKTRYVSNYWVAVQFAAMGDREAAIAELEKAYQARDWFLPRLKTDPFMDPVRDDPRFVDLVRRVGLSNY